MRNEFEFIRNIKKNFALGRVGDDCAVLPKNSTTDLVITADMLVEDVDFRLKWTTPEFLGHKALAVSLSDIAAMGARPKWAMLSIGVPKSLWRSRFVDRFYEGWFDLAKEHKVELIGGDVSRSPDRFVVDCIVAGEVKKGAAILRSGARAGDSIFVTGSLGGAALALRLLESGKQYSRAGKHGKVLLARQLRPIPRVETGRLLAKNKAATSMIDISDGLGADLHHLCEASGVGARIEFDEIPVDDALREVASHDQRRLVLGGGEDFELLFTSRKKKFSVRKLSLVTRIGEVTENTGIVELVVNGRMQDLPADGYRHF